MARFDDEKSEYILQKIIITNDNLNNDYSKIVSKNLVKTLNLVDNVLSDIKNKSSTTYVIETKNNTQAVSDFISKKVTDTIQKTASTLFDNLLTSIDSTLSVDSSLRKMQKDFLEFQGSLSAGLIEPQELLWLEKKMRSTLDGFNLASKNKLLEQFLKSPAVTIVISADSNKAIQLSAVIAKVMDSQTTFASGYFANYFRSLITHWGSKVECDYTRDSIAGLIEQEITELKTNKEQVLSWPEVLNSHFSTDDKSSDDQLLFKILDKLVQRNTHPTHVVLQSLMGYLGEFNHKDHFNETFEQLISKYSDAFNKPNAWGLYPIDYYKKDISLTVSQKVNKSSRFFKLIQCMRGHETNSIKAATAKIDLQDYKTLRNTKDNQNAPELASEQLVLCGINFTQLSSMCSKHNQRLILSELKHGSLQISARQFVSTLEVVREFLLFAKTHEGEVSSQHLSKITNIQSSLVNFYGILKQISTIEQTEESGISFAKQKSELANYCEKLIDVVNLMKSDILNEKRDAISKSIQIEQQMIDITPSDITQTPAKSRVMRQGMAK